MSSADSPAVSRDQDAEPARSDQAAWWHRDHPTFAALTGFFSGMLFVTALPGALIAVLRLGFSHDDVEGLLPWSPILLLLPLALVIAPRTRRFGVFMWIGMLLTAVVVAGVASVALYFLVQRDV